MAESMRLLLLLVKSDAHREVAVEFAEYVQYLTLRSIDYSTEAVLAFDSDFRSRVQFERITLADSDCRRSIADRYFHAATRIPVTHAETQRSRSSRGGSRTSMQYSNVGQPQIPMLNGIPICRRWNAGFCDPQRRCNCAKVAPPLPFAGFAVNATRCRSALESLNATYVPLYRRENAISLRVRFLARTHCISATASASTRQSGPRFILGVVWSVPGRFATVSAACAQLARCSLTPVGQ